MSLNLISTLMRTTIVKIVVSLVKKKKKTRIVPNLFCINVNYGMYIDISKKINVDD